MPEPCASTDSIPNDDATSCVLRPEHADDGEPECVVCWAADASVLFQPCGHFCTCSDCAEPFLWQSVACPMCRTPISAGVVVSN